MDTTVIKNSLQGGTFIIQESKANSIFVPEEWTEEQLMIADMVRDFIEKEIHPIIDDIDSQKDPALVPGLLEKAGELGLLSLHVPEQYGGMDLDFNTGLLFSEVIAESFSFATTIGAQTSIGSLPIVFYGNDDQKAKYLPKLNTGEWKCCYCLTEPDAGSDANSGKSKVVLNEAKTHYILNGQKMWITNGGFADVFIVFAKVDDDEKLSAFIVEKSFGGVTIGEEEKKMGIKGSSTVQVFFSETPVPVENMLGEREGGFKMALNILNTGRIKLAVGGIGGSKFATSNSVKYANERKQFEQSISEFGAIKHKIGEMATRTFVSESGSYRIGGYIDEKTAELKAAGMSNQKAKLEAVREFAVECAIMKVHGSEVLAYCVDEAVQIFGGMGYSQEAGVERGYRDARITRIYEGTNEINRLLSVGELGKRALKDKTIDLVSNIKSLPMKVMFGMNSVNGNPAYKDHKKMVNNLKRVFLLIFGSAGNKLKKKMIDEQEIVMNLADILAEAYVCESAFMRVEKLASREGFDKTKLKMMEKMAELYLYTALQRVEQAGENAILSYADGFEKTMMMRWLNKLTRRPNINPKNQRREIADYVISKNEYPF